MARSDLMPRWFSRRRAPPPGRSWRCWGMRRPPRGAGGFAAAAEVVEAQNAEAVRVERAAGPDDLAPPALARILRQAHAAIGGDAAEGADHRRVRRARPCATRCACRRACRRDAATSRRAAPGCLRARVTSCAGADARASASAVSSDGTDSSEAFIGCSASHQATKAHRQLSQSTRSEAGSSRPSSARLEAERRLRRPLICRPALDGWIAGVGTFPSGLGLGGCPGFKGPFPQPVSMSGGKSRVGCGTSTVRAYQIRVMSAVRGTCQGPDGAVRRGPSATSVACGYARQFRRANVLAR